MGNLGGNAGNGEKKFEESGLECGECREWGGNVGNQGGNAGNQGGNAGNRGGNAGSETEIEKRNESL